MLRMVNLALSLRKRDYGSFYLPDCSNAKRLSNRGPPEREENMRGGDAALENRASIELLPGRAYRSRD